MHFLYYSFIVSFLVSGSYSAFQSKYSVFLRIFSNPIGHSNMFVPNVSFNLVHYVRRRIYAGIGKYQGTLTLAPSVRYRWIISGLFISLSLCLFGMRYVGCVSVCFLSAVFSVHSLGCLYTFLLLSVVCLLSSVYLQALCLSLCLVYLLTICSLTAF